MLLPSVRSTIRSSAVTLTACARGIVSALEVRIPCLQKQRLIFRDDFFQITQFRSLETTCIYKTYRPKPKLCRTFFPHHVDMWRFLPLVAVEEKSVRPDNSYRRHRYPSPSHHPAKQDIKSFIGSHRSRNSRANAPAKLRALSEKEASRQLQPVVSTTVS